MLNDQRRIWLLEASKGITDTSMRILLDNGVFSHSEFAEPSIRRGSERWGNTKVILPVHGLVRKSPDKNRKYQAQKEALFTVGRLIREGDIEAYDYTEIQFERARGQIQLGMCNALTGCTIHRCLPALERSRFRQTVNLTDILSKGGKKDRKAGVVLGEANQIAFFQWLCTLRKEQVAELIRHAAMIGLTAFEIESLRNIEWFQFLCERSGSSENCPDVFHLWTAERNGLDALLTLEMKGLPNLVSRVRNEKKTTIKIKTEVLRPLELLQKLGISEPDPVPLDPGRFYHLHELLQ